MIRDNKSNYFSPITQGVSEETYAILQKIVSENIKKSISEARNEFRDRPLQYSAKRSRTDWITSCIKKHFELAIIKQNDLRKHWTKTKSHGVDYHVIEGKAIFCFKKMDNKGYVSNYRTERFKSLMAGNVITYSSTMLNLLAELGIHKPLPVYFIGYILDNHGSLLDIRITHYDNDQIVFEDSIYMNENISLFNTNDSEVTDDDIQVIPKRKKNLGDNNIGDKDLA